MTSTTPRDFCDTYPVEHRDDSPTQPVESLVDYASGFRWGAVCGFVAGALTAALAALVAVGAQTLLAH